MRNGVPERQARLVIDPCVLSREDLAQTGLRRHVVVAGKGPNDAWQDVRGDADLILVPPKKADSTVAPVALIVLWAPG